MTFGPSRLHKGTAALKDFHLAHADLIERYINLRHVRDNRTLTYRRQIANLARETFGYSPSTSDSDIVYRVIRSYMTSWYTMDQIFDFLALTIDERLMMLRDPPASFIMTNYHDLRRHDYYVYTNFFVELVYDDKDEQDLIEINAFRDGPRVYELIKMLEADDR